MTFPWYAHYHADFLKGANFRSLEEDGALIRLLDTLYATDDGLIPDDDQALARLWGGNRRSASRLKKRLLESGKIHAQDGYLTSRRVQLELNKMKTTSISRRLAAQIRWNNKGTGHANGYANHNHNKKERRGPPMEVAQRYPTSPTISPELERIEQSRGRKW